MSIKMKRLFKCILAVGMTAFIAATVFAVTEEEAAEEIFPQADSFKAKQCRDIYYVEVSEAGSLKGYCIDVTGRGYCGPIYMVVGIDLEGIIKGVRIISHKETPGIGSRIDETLPGERRPRFLEQFVGKCGRTVTLKKDVDAVSGATISSNAVTSAINSSVNSFLSGLKEKAPAR